MSPQPYRQDLAIDRRWPSGFEHAVIGCCAPTICGVGCCELSTRGRGCVTVDMHGGQHVLERQRNVVGSGFLASGLREAVAIYPHWTLYAAGPGSEVTSVTEYTRDAQRLYRSLATCRVNQQRIIYLSTSSAHLYGRNPSVSRENDPVEPYSAYGRHKLAMETVIRQSGVGFLILRLPNPVGSHQPREQLVPAMISRIHAGQVTVWSGARRDLMALADIAAITSALLHADVVNEVVNIGTGQAAAALDIVHLLCELLQKTPDITVQETPREPTANIRKLRMLLPGLTLPGGADYYRRVLHEHLAALKRTDPGPPPPETT